MNKKLIGLSVVAVVLTGLGIVIRYKSDKELYECIADSSCSQIDHLVELLADGTISPSEYKIELIHITCCQNYITLPKKYKTRIDSSLDYAKSLIVNQ